MKKCLGCLALFLIILFSSIQVNATNEETFENSTGGNSVSENVQELESEKYIIDENNKVIYRVIPETQVDVFKNNFNMPDNVEVYLDSDCTEEVDSGIIGTGMYIKNLVDNTVYEISTIGDFNGDGEIGLIEITNLIRHVVGLRDYQLSGVIAKSADLNNDNNLNIVDITLIIRYIVYGELEIPENPKMDQPTLEVVSGNLGENNWYTNDVEIKINSNNSEDIIDKTTYMVQGTDQVAETEIKDGETFKITKDGTWIITAYNYNKAGSRIESEELTIQRDSTDPNMSKVSAKDINVDSFVLVGEGSDETSGVITYEFYLDNELISTVNTNVKQVEIPVTGKKPGIYKAYIIVTDNAGHEKKSEEIDVQTTRLTQSELDYFEFVVTEFNVENADGSQEGVTATISDTSLTSNSKYIMVNSEKQDVKGSVIGKLRLVCKDGTVVENLAFFPEELTINMAYYAGGSGTVYTHNNEANFFGININEKNVQDGETAETSIIISNENVKENKFVISDEKLTGTQTYTRATINSISLNGKDLLFRIVQEN